MHRECSERVFSVKPPLVVGTAQESASKHHLELYFRHFLQETHIQYIYSSHLEKIQLLLIFLRSDESHIVISVSVVTNPHFPHFLSHHYPDLDQSQSEFNATTNDFIRKIVH